MPVSTPMIRSIVTAVRAKCETDVSHDSVIRETRHTSESIIPSAPPWFAQPWLQFVRSVRQIWDTTQSCVRNDTIESMPVCIPTTRSVVTAVRAKCEMDVSHDTVGSEKRHTRVLYASWHSHDPLNRDCSSWEVCDRCETWLESYVWHDTLESIMPVSTPTNHKYTDIQKYISIFKYKYTYICIYLYLHIYIYVHIYGNIYTYTYTYIYMYICIYIFIHDYTYIHIYIYIYVCIYVYTCTNIDIQIRKNKYIFKCLCTWREILAIISY